MKKKTYCVSLTDGIYREPLKSMNFATEKEADAAFVFACSLDNSLPFDVELKTYILETKTNQYSKMESLRFRKYFENASERGVFNALCRYAFSRIHLQSKALQNNEKPYGTVCDWIKDDFGYEHLTLKQRHEIAEAVCNYYGITI